MNQEQITERMDHNLCIRCGHEMSAEVWVFVVTGVLFARCPIRDCGCRQLCWLFDRETGKAMFDENVVVTEQDLPGYEGHLGPRHREDALEALSQRGDDIPADPWPPEPSTASEDDARLTDDPDPDEEPESWTAADEAKAAASEERAERARANLRILQGVAPKMPAAEPEVDAFEEATAARAAASTKHEHAAADRKLRKAKKTETAKKQKGFAGLWGKDRK